MKPQSNDNQNGNTSRGRFKQSGEVGLRAEGGGEYCRGEELTSEDREQFVKLWGKHRPQLYAYVLSLIPNWADADEVFQETNVRLWRDFARFDEGTDFGAWAASIAYYQVLTWRKRQSRSRLMFDESTVSAIADSQEQVMPLVEARCRALRECFKGLSGRNRELLAKCYAPGVSMSEVGVTVGKSRSALYKSLQRIRASLRTCIERRIQRDRQL